ncbi:hypothetical protein SASPL_157714 [Salvia splendens]|uniref:Uncharacterized protein n=1 Tax=Salvia splendens TaxID=180675 RepID=A0A8X8YUH7_SALSN|nr:hypothetical protein SASPL_157714 [Salvia splendens]
MSELCISKSRFSSPLISDFFIFLYSSILSHPLYFSYLIFFSPYLLKLLSFLSPLFLTTCLISLAFLQRLQLNRDHHPNEELQSCELYEIFFGPPSMAEVREESHHTPQKDPILEPIPLPGLAGEAPIAASGKIKTPAMEEEKRFDDSVIMNAVVSRSNSLSSCGSMRREREWRRTLAGKLFEERHSGGGEGMDSLWEMDSNKSGGRRKKVVEVEEEEDGENEIRLCCLQALKMSAGKMNLGVGRPNLVKISKAIKGIGWLHLHKSSKKVHNNADHK